MMTDGGRSPALDERFDRSIWRTGQGVWGQSYGPLVEKSIEEVSISPEEQSRIRNEISHCSRSYSKKMSIVPLQP